MKVLENFQYNNTSLVKNVIQNAKEKFNNWLSIINYQKIRGKKMEEKKKTEIQNEWQNQMAEVLKTYFKVLLEWTQEKDLEVKGE